MCAERSGGSATGVIADALVARGIDVSHIMSPRQATPHELTTFARVTAQKVQYPAMF